MSISEKSDKKDFNFNSSHKKRTEKVLHLTDYRKVYSINIFIEDLVVYFDNQVDFNLDKIRQEIEKPQRLDKLIKKASQKNTHPVTEFVQELFQNLGQSGAIKWSGE